MRALREDILAWLAEGRSFALATVTRVSGSGPRAAGSCLIIASDGSKFLGSVSSGCLENEVIEAGVSVLASGGVRELRFGPEGKPPWREGLSCGGQVLVRVEPWWSFSTCAKTKAVGEAVSKSLSSGEELVVLSRDEKHLALSADRAAMGDLDAFSPSEKEFALARLRDGGTPVLIESDGVFVRTLRAPRRLLVIGAVDIARHLTSFAAPCGFTSIIVDPRKNYATTERFPTLRAEDRLRCAWPAEAVPELGLRPRDAAVVLTHDPKIDDAGLEELLRTHVGYIGALGSWSSHDRRLARLQERGCTPESLKRIEGPAGIHLGGRDPAEIALGIMAGVARWKASQEHA